MLKHIIFAMHPTLEIETTCSDQIQLLIQCHNEHKMKKYIGYCNQIKLQLDDCLLAEHHDVRKLNKSSADDKIKKWKDLKKQYT